MEPLTLAALGASIAGVIASMIPIIKKLLLFRCEAKKIEQAKMELIVKQTNLMRSEAELLDAEARHHSTKKTATEVEVAHERLLATKRLVEAIKTLREAGGDITISIEPTVPKTEGKE